MLRGSLDDFSLEDILWLVARADKTGELFVNRPPGSGRFFFRAGKIDHVETDLLRGSVAAEAVAGAREVVEDAAFELLRRDLGDFSWNPGVLNQTGSTLALGVEDVLAACAQRAAELQAIRAVIPSDESILAIAASPPENIEEVTVNRRQWGLLAYVDGRRTIEALARDARLAEFHVLKTLHPLAERGLLEVRSGAETTTPGPGTTHQVDLTNSPEGAPSAPAAFPHGDGQ